MKALRRKIAISVLSTIIAILTFNSCSQQEIAPEPKLGSIAGTVSYLNADDNSGILLTLDKTDGIRTIANSDNSKAVAGMCYSNPDGSFSFNDLEPGTYTVYASSNDSLEKAVSVNVVVRELETTVLEALQLTATGSISGRVKVDNSLNGNSGFLVFVAGTSFMAMTDDSGNYCISGVPAGSGYTLVVSKGNYISSEVRTVEVQARATKDAGISYIRRNDVLDGNGMIFPNTLVWKGSFASSDELTNPVTLWAYFNTTDCCTYIYNGKEWEVLAKGDSHERFVVTFVSNCKATIEPITVYSGGPVGKPEDPEKLDCDFLGWFLNEKCTVPYDFSRAVTSDLTLYASWSIHDHSNPILPAGTGQVIPTDWSTDSNGLTGLPDIIYNFAGDVDNTTNVTMPLKTAVTETPQSFFSSTPKNVILIIGHGMGISHLDISREYKGELIMDSLPYYTQSLTDCYKKADIGGTSKIIPDAPASSTQILCGYKTRYGYIGLDIDGNPVKNLTELAKENGWKTAVVTNDTIVGATPADAMIHDTNRYHSDVLYYKALMYAMCDQGLDLLMGWDWGTGRYDNSDTWATKLLAAEKEGIKDAIDVMGITTKYDGGDPVAYFKNLSTEEKAKMAGFSIYYCLWEKLTGRINSFMTWTTTGEADLEAYLEWLESSTGLAEYVANLEVTYGSPADHVNRFTTFTKLVQNTDTSFAKPVLGSWYSDGYGYESATPNKGYLLHGTIGKNYPSWPEMVAYTIYQMDKEADEADTGFFAMIENYCTDGWGHSNNSDTKVYGTMNEVQCFDEGVAIAVKYVLEHPDTLLVVTSNHETGGYEMATGWENDISLIRSKTTGHSNQNVPLYAFGAGADRFSAEAIGAVHEGYVTGQIIGQLMGDPDFGQPAGYP